MEVEDFEILPIEFTFVLITYTKAGTQGADKNVKERNTRSRRLKG